MSWRGNSALRGEKGSLKRTNEQRLSVATTKPGHSGDAGWRWINPVELNRREVAAIGAV
jgi:hypothetical protein